jgi:hypothetical protein
VRKGAVGGIGLWVGAKEILSTTPLASATTTESLCPLEGMRINANPRASREGGTRLLLSTAAAIGSSAVVAFAPLATITLLLLLLTTSGAASTLLWLLLWRQRLLGTGRWAAVCAAAARGGRCNEGVGVKDRNGEPERGE